MRASITVNVGAIVRNMPRDERVQFVKELDLALGDWDSTLDLIAYFETQRQEYLAECAESGEEIDERAKVKL